MAYDGGCGEPNCQLCHIDFLENQLDYHRHRYEEMLALLRESQISIGGDWRARRDKIIAQVDFRPTIDIYGCAPA